MKNLFKFIALKLFCFFKVIPLLFVWFLFTNEGELHDPPPTLIYDWGDINPNVKIWYSKSITKELQEQVEININKSTHYTKPYPNDKN